jgi:hypothetical protein
MDKDDNLFEDGIKESSDLLDIDFDDLPGDVTDESKGEEDDDGIIDLIDLVEKGDAELFSDDDIVKEDVHIPDEEIDSQTEEKDALDDILREAGMATTADDSGINPLEDLSADLLSVDTLPDDSDNAPSEEDITGDMFEKLLDDTVLDELTDDADELPEETEEFNLEPEDFSDLESVLEEEPLHDEKIAESPTATAGVQGNLFRDFDPVASTTEETHGLDNEFISDPDIFGDELEKTITSSDDVTNEKSLWGTDADSNTLNAEAEGISILEEASSDDEKIEYSGMDTEDADYINIDDIQLDSKSLESLFPDEGVTSEPVSDDTPRDESQDLRSSDLLDIDQPEALMPEEPVVSQIQVTDEIKPVDAIPTVQIETIVQPVISEEKIEEIVTKVVGEVVERVAREVFKEVAEKVISEAIEGLKKSLEAELE